MQCYQTPPPSSLNPLPGLTEKGQTPITRHAVLPALGAPPEQLRNSDLGFDEVYSWEENFYHPPSHPPIVWQWHPSVPCLAQLFSQLAVLILVLLKGKGQPGCDIRV